MILRGVAAPVPRSQQPGQPLPTGHLRPVQKRQQWVEAERLLPGGRRAVGIDATAPNSPWRSRSTSMPVTASAPSAIATARSANICPGICSGNPR